MGTPGPLELLLLFAVVLLIFGAKRIPEIARGIGKGIREFKDATSEISRELEAEGQKRQINQPQAPEQGAPQARQPKKEPAPPQPEAAEQTEEQQPKRHGDRGSTE
ncbi:MAG: twin-arginine translocase TatA/TatE family subunit [Salinivenus sp.]